MGKYYWQGLIYFDFLAEQVAIGEKDLYLLVIEFVR
jgi:hypothetical protein